MVKFTNCCKKITFFRKYIPEWGGFVGKNNQLLHFRVFFLFGRQILPAWNTKKNKIGVSGYNPEEMEGERGGGKGGDEGCPSPDPPRLADTKGGRWKADTKGGRRKGKEKRPQGRGVFRRIRRIRKIRNIPIYPYIEISRFRDFERSKLLTHFRIFIGRL